MADKVIDPRNKKLDHMDLIQRFDDAAKSRRPWENDWYLNLSYLNNEQNVAFVEDTGTLLRLDDVEDDDTKTMHNVMLKIARIERAKILRTKPRPTVMPANNDDDSYTTARILESFCDQLMWEWDFPRRMRHSIYWLIATGNVFYKWYWDSGPQLDVVPPFEMYPDPYVREFEHSRWAIHSRFYDLETAWDMYGDLQGARTQYLDCSDTRPLSSIEQRIYSDINGSSESGLRGVNIREYWEPPVGKRKGRYAVFTDAGIVYEDEFPYEHGELPFTHVTHIVRSQTKWAGSIMDYMRPLQDELNHAESQNIENRVLMNGKWWVPPGVELESEPSGEARQILRGIGGGNPNLKPEFIQPSGYPAWAGQEPGRYKDAMQDLASQHEVSNGGTPGRVESGQAIQLLQESDDAVIRDAIDSHEEAIARGFWQEAALFKQYGDPSYLVRAYDENGALEVRELFKDKIDLAFRVRVQTTTALPTSAAGKSDRVLNWLQYQVITPEDARELLDLSSENPSLLPYLRDKLNASQENVRMKNSEDQIPQLWDDHDVHLDMHYGFMKTEEFRTLAPEAQEAFVQHTDIHMELKKEVLMREAEFMMISQGGAMAPPDEEAPAGPEAPADPEGAGPPPPTGAP